MNKKDRKAFESAFGIVDDVVFNELEGGYCYQSHPNQIASGSVAQLQFEAWMAAKEYYTNGKSVNDANN